VNSTLVSPAIKDFYTTDNQGIILLSGTTMQEIYKKSGTLADANEFQVHYWFLNFRFRAEDNSILDIAIPTCYFNYEQFVSGAHIDFELKDVKELSEKLLPLHNMKANQLIDMGIKEKLEATFNVTFEMMAMDFGSIHKHPGGSSRQSFSGTDYCKTAAEPGVVFPLATASDDTPNFAGIMALDSKECNVAHYEYRTVNGTLGTDIEYVEGRCAAYTVFPKKPDERSFIEKLLNFGADATSKWKFKRCTSALEVVPAIEAVAEWLYLDEKFSASTDVVLPENVKKKASTVVTYNYGTTKKAYKEIPTYKELNLLPLYQVNDQLKSCAAKLNMLVPKYEVNKITAITEVLKLQNIIKEFSVPCTEESLEGKNIKELNNIYNNKYLDVHGIVLYRYITSKETLIKDIMELQAKGDVKEETKDEPFKILTEKELRALTIPELVKHVNSVNDAYYGVDFEDAAAWVTELYTVANAPQPEVLISEGLAIQKWLLAEAAETAAELEEEPDPITPDRSTPSIDIITAALKSFGTDPVALENATDEQLRSWYMSLEN